MIAADNKYLKEIPDIWQRISFNGYNTGYITTKIKPTKYGFIIHRFSNYISLQYIRYEVFEDGFSKATVRVERNYSPKYQYTLYFDQNKKEIKSVDNSTRKELRQWKQLRQQIK